MPSWNIFSIQPQGLRLTTEPYSLLDSIQDILNIIFLMFLRFPWFLKLKFSGGTKGDFNQQTNHQPAVETRLRWWPSARINFKRCSTCRLARIGSWFTWGSFGFSDLSEIGIHILDLGSLDFIGRHPTCLKDLFFNFGVIKPNLGVFGDERDGTWGMSQISGCHFSFIHQPVNICKHQIIPFSIPFSLNNCPSFWDKSIDLCT